MKMVSLRKYYDQITPSLPHFSYIDPMDRLNFTNQPPTTSICGILDSICHLTSNNLSYKGGGKWE